MLSGRKAHTLGKRSPEGSSPIRPPQPILEKVDSAAIQRCVDAVFIPKRIAKANGNIVGACLINGKTVGSRAFISEGDQSFRYRNHAFIAVRLCVMVDDNISELRLLLLGIGGQIPSSVVGFRHLRIFLANSISAFHVVIHMRQCPRSHIVIIPIGNNGDERLRRCIIGKVIQTLHPIFCSIIGVGCTTIILTEVFRGIVYLPVPTIGRHTKEHLIGVHYLGGIIINAFKPTSWRNGTWCRTRPSHTVTHDGCRITVFIQITIHAPVLTAD
ncbi:hypothetical protein DSECCO2_484240 [anaerobic digester metagenome]